MTDWNPQANKILLEALEIDSADARSEYLERACAGNSALRAAVDELLAAHAGAGEFLQNPPDETAAETPRATGSMFFSQNSRNVRSASASRPSSRYRSARLTWVAMNPGSSRSACRYSASA